MLEKGVLCLLDIYLHEGGVFPGNGCCYWGWKVVILIKLKAA